MKTAPFFKDGINIVQKDALHLYDLIKVHFLQKPLIILDYSNLSFLGCLST